MLFWITDKSLSGYKDMCEKYATPIKNSEGNISYYKIGKHQLHPTVETFHTELDLSEETKIEVAFVQNHGDLIVDLANALNKPVTFFPDVEPYGLLLKEFDGVVVIESK